MQIFENVSAIKIPNNSAAAIIDFYIKKYVDKTLTVIPDVFFVDATVLKNGKKMKYEDIIDFIEKLAEISSFEIDWNEGYVDEGLALVDEEIYGLFQTVIDFYFGEQMVYKTQIDETTEEDEENYCTLIIYRGELPTDLISILAYFKLSN